MRRQRASATRPPRFRNVHVSYRDERGQMTDVMQSSAMGIDRHRFVRRPGDDMDIGMDIGHVGVGDSRRDDRAGCF